MSRTYAILEISKCAFTEIAEKLRKAGYNDAFHEDRAHSLVIDMHGIAVAPPQPPADGIEEAEITLWAKSMYGAKTGKGLVELEIRGAEITCSPTEARAFAYSILEAAESAETDEFIMTWLDSCGIEDRNKRGSILIDFRKQRDEMRKR